VPAAPKIRDAEGFVGRVEILRETDTEKIAEADCHVAVPGEVKIDLIGVAEDAEPGAEGGEMRGVFPGGIDDGGDGVGEEDFFHHADGEEGPADVEPAGAIGVIEIIEIGFDLTEANDGSGNELRKERDVAGKFPEIARGSDDATVGVNHIADGVEGVEGDADGKNDVERGRVDGNVEPRRDLGKARDGEIEIFEEAEEKKIYGDGEDQEEFAATRVSGTEHAEAGKVADRGGESHEGAEFVVPRAVENVAGDGEPDVAVLFCAETPEAEVHDWQEEKKKDEAVKEHEQASESRAPGRFRGKAAEGLRRGR
jgi:hypothetical protein